MNYEIEVKPYPTELSWQDGWIHPYQLNPTSHILVPRVTIQFQWYDKDTDTYWNLSPEEYGRLWLYRHSYDTWEYNWNGYQWVDPYHCWFYTDANTYRYFGPPAGWADFRDFDPEFFSSTPFSENRWWWFARHIVAFAWAGWRIHSFLWRANPDGSPVAKWFIQTDTYKYLVSFHDIKGQYPGFDYNGAPNEAETVPRPVFMRPFGDPQIFKDIHTLLVDAQPDIMADINPPRLWDKKWFYRAIQTLQAGWNYKGEWTTLRRSRTDYWFDPYRNSPQDHDEQFALRDDIPDLDPDYPVRTAWTVEHLPREEIYTVTKLESESDG